MAGSAGGDSMWRDAAADGNSESAEPTQHAEYSVVHWTGGGLTFRAVTDTSPADFRTFHAAYMRE